MNDPIREQLSAFADGELSAEEQRFLLRRLAQDTELRVRYGRYELIRSCLRGHDVAGHGATLVSRVMAAIGEEPVAQQARQRWLRPVLGGAMAAAVAALALVLVAPPPVSDTPSAPAVVASTGLREQDLRPTLVAQPVAGRIGSSAPVMAMPDPQLEAYLLRHGNAAMSAPRGGYVPYVYVVASPVVRAGAQPASTYAPAAASSPRVP